MAATPKPVRKAIKKAYKGAVPEHKKKSLHKGTAKKEIKFLMHEEKRRRMK